MCLFSHGLHSSCSMLSHGIHGIHRTFLLYVLPRIALFLQYVLPRNSRNTQNLLTVYSPTEFTEFTEEVAESILPQIAQIFTEPSCREFCGRISRQSNLRGRVTSQSPARHARADRRCTARSGGCRTTRHGWQTAVRDAPTRARGGASGR